MNTDKGENLLPSEGEVYLVENFLDEDESKKFFDELLDSIDWHQDKIRMFGKVHLAPRLTAWYGDPGISYAYSGVQLKASGWTPALKAIKNRLEELSGESFNSVLLNLYRDGQDSMGWHADDEKELGLNPVIASISLGQERVFHLRNKKDKQLKVKIPLKNGSLLLMQGATQHHWQHQIPKTKKPQQERINLTFRKVIER